MQRSPFSLPSTHLLGSRFHHSLAEGRTNVWRVADESLGGEDDSVLSNADLGELLATAGRDESDHRRRALERASRAARFWPQEAGELVAAGGSLTELNAVGPWVAAKIQAWLDDPPGIPEAEETRRGFLTYAEVRRVLDAEPGWESEPCADLQMHTT